jgi:hypothetical protein
VRQIESFAQPLAGFTTPACACQRHAAIPDQPIEPGLSLKGGQKRTFE